jgi:hypothetical protein
LRRLIRLIRLMSLTLVAPRVSYCLVASSRPADTPCRAQDRLVPLDSAHWLSELLYGLDVQTSFRPYRILGHFDLITELMKGLEGEYSARLERDCEWQVPSGLIGIEQRNEIGLMSSVRDFIREEPGKR